MSGIGGIFKLAAPMVGGGASGPLDTLKKAASPVAQLLGAVAPLAEAAASTTPIGMGITAAAGLLGAAASASPDNSKMLAENKPSLAESSFNY